jgi:Cft2 family RNA processing exonuclease
VDKLSCFPFAVGQADEGIAFLLKIGPYRVLLDCGLNNIAVLGDLQPADFVICSHAHGDHARGILALSRAFPALPIYASHTTLRLLQLTQAMGHFTELPTEPPTEPPTDVLPPAYQGLPWRTAVEIAPDLSLQLWPAGHLPGAACILLTYQDRAQTPTRYYRCLYMGDCFVSQMRLVEGLPMEELRGLNPDVLVIEGSYGNQVFPHRRQQENRLVNRLRDVLLGQRSTDAFGNGFPCVVFPVPLLGLGQEILALVRSHHHFTGYPMTIWVDPLIAAGCDAYLECLEDLPKTVQNFARYQPLFWDERVFPQVKRLPLDGSFTLDAPALLLVHPATLPDLYGQAQPGQWTVFLPELPHAALDLACWQQEVSAGSVDHPDWLDALKNATASGALNLETYFLGDHCDGAGTVQLIHNVRSHHVVFLHGTPQQLADLSDLNDLQSRYQLHIAQPNQVLDLFVGETPWPVPPPEEAPYEGMLIDTLEELLIELPEAIKTDPRWVQLADTGILKLRWQGDSLVVQGISAADLRMKRLSQAATNGASCAICRYYQAQKCRNTLSPLFGRNVAPDGYCAEFKH